MKLQFGTALPLSSKCLTLLLLHIQPRSHHETTCRHYTAPLWVYHGSENPYPTTPPASPSTTVLQTTKSHPRRRYITYTPTRLAIYYANIKRSFGSLQPPKNEQTPAL
jgi:hypothetical protein